MSLGLIGKKLGMTQVYQEDGSALAVTVVHVGGNQVLQIKNGDTDGYAAVQLGYAPQKESRLNKPELGHFARWGADAKKFVKEFRVEEGEALPASGEELGAGFFQVGQWVDVVGTSKGKGFQGAMRRHNFKGQRQTHGSMMHRRTGAIAAGSTPGRVWKNQKMPGHQGAERCTTQNLKIVGVREDDGVILVSGSIPGHKGAYLVVRPAKKKPAIES
jgi:large subunit ribosomal protein L3